MAQDFRPRYAITFGEVAIAHVGGAELRAENDRRPGFTVAELAEVARRADGGELVRVSDALPPERRPGNEAAVLVLRGGARLLGADPDALLREQEGVAYDRKYWDPRLSPAREERGSEGALNKQARFNAVFGEAGRPHSPDYRLPTVTAFGAVPRLAALRAALPALLGPKAAGLNAEGNLYHRRESGIGFHGDSERRVVICLSLGGEMTLRYCWRLPGSSAHPYPPVDIRVGHGDVYVMSEKATGHDWRLRGSTRVVHAAGAPKYIG